MRLALCVFGVAASCQAGSPSASLRWTFLGNDQPEPGVCVSEIELAIAPGDLPSKAEAHLYFNFVRKPAESPGTAHGAGYEHVNGDLFRLLIDPAAITSGVFRTRLTSQGSVLNVTDAPAGFFLVRQDTTGVERATSVAASIDLSSLNSTSGRGSPAPHRPNAETLDTAPLIPQPVSYLARSVFVDLNGLPVVCGEGHDSTIELLVDTLVNAGADKPARQPSIESSTAALRLTVGEVRVAGVAKSLGDEAYSLEIDPVAGIRIVGSDPAGLYYGVQTLAALIADAAGSPENAGEPKLRAIAIQDAPYFGYRGLHLDVARNFQTTATVRKLLDLMAAYKLNRFHFHLTDDEGWRVAIRGLPELTSVGGRRGFSTDSRRSLPPSFGSGPDTGSLPGSGHYTREEFVALLRYAAARHIEVIPEVDLPGHARAAIQAMQTRYDRFLAQGDTEEAERYLLRKPDDPAVYESVQLWDDNVVDVRLASSEAFVEHVVGDLASMYNEAGLRLKTIHFGGDEVPAGCWESADSGDRQALFVSFMDRCAEIAGQHGARFGGWEEIFLDTNHEPHPSPGPAAKGLCYAWNNIWGWGFDDAAYRLANAGSEVVLCGATHLYFDLAYNGDIDELGYYWAGTTDTEEVFRFRPLRFFEGEVRDRAGNAVDPDAVRTKATLSEAGSARIRGIQGQLWGENLTSADRVEYLGFPRLLALAERAWVGPHFRQGPTVDPPRSWDQFARQLVEKELPRLDLAFGGVKYRVPTARVRRVGESIDVSSDLPGMTVRYTTDGSDPTDVSEQVARSLPADGEYRFRVFNSVGRGGRTTAWTPGPTQDSPK